MRVGIGYDVHPLAAGRRLRLGGVEFDHPRGLVGHSDADVVLHAIADALLGAAALGDIGYHFPPGDERYRDADSLDLLRAVRTMLMEAGWQAGNVDVTIIAEEPRIGPRALEMRQRIASAIGILPGAVSVKATTNEKLGSIGRAEGIAAMAVATIVATDTGPN